MGELVIHYRCDYPEWSFKHKEIDFISYSPQFILPSIEELDAIVSDLENLKDEMFNRCRIYWKKYDNASDGELLSVNLESFAENKMVSIGWCAMDDSWGDMGVDFLIQDGTIKDECWGD